MSKFIYSIFFLFVLTESLIAQGFETEKDIYYDMESPLVAKGFLFNSYYIGDFELGIKDLIYISEFEQNEIAGKQLKKGKKEAMASNILALSGIAFILGQMSANYLSETQNLNSEPLFGAIGFGLLTCSLSFKIKSKNSFYKGIKELNKNRKENEN